ncbi:MAG: hypothetical protein M0R02_00050 [Bacteroidales bacterium]|nr:hypothetical protein [Bacteroidales bacterium]NLK81561.1 hypothetical protein [Bacteroidales bacterium]
MKTIITTCIFLMFLSNLGIAQESGFSSRQNTNTYIWSIAPQFTAENAMRIDIERRYQNGSSVVLAPRFYVKSPNSEEEGNNGKMLGIGGELFHKIRINELSNPLRGYIMYGMLYNFYDVIQVEAEWVTDETLGITTFVGRDEDKHIGINKFGPNLAIGLEMEPVERFIIDLYAGVGARYSLVSYGDKSFINSHSSIFDMGYTGIVPLIVFKVGVVF